MARDAKVRKNVDYGNVCEKRVVGRGELFLSE